MADVVLCCFGRNFNCCCTTHAWSHSTAGTSVGLSVRGGEWDNGDKQINTAKQAEV